jgi:small conductance mechanosensitive channel
MSTSTAALFGFALRAAEDDTAQSAESTESTETTVDVVCGNAGAFCETIYEWTDNELLAEATSFILGVPIKILIIVLGALFVNRLLRRGIDRLTERLGTVTADHGDAIVNERNVERAEERASTIGSLLRSASAALVLGLAVIMILEVLGIGVVAVIASAGVLSLAIGFGAQSVVEDLLRGLFMLGEDQFAVGDRIDVGKVNGVVERVTLRTVVIRDPTGVIWHIPNSEIDWVANENQVRSRAKISIGIAYDVDLDEAIEVLDRAARAAAEEPDWRDLIDSEPQVRGVDELGDDAVTIGVIVWVDAGARRRFERHLRRRLKQALDEAGIEMPNRQLDVWIRDQPDATVENAA